MTEYNPITAKHYAVYRPSLHLPILQKCLDENARFELGLDVGCGTGQSALALTKFCDKVIAIDPSKAMLQNATPHEQINYQHCNGQDLDFKVNTFDIITFAGALYYAKSQHLLNEVVKVAKPNAKVIIYDFEILLDPTLTKLGITPPTKMDLAYDHEVDFSGLDMLNLYLQNKVKEEIPFEISTNNLGHLLLADNDHYALLVVKFDRTDLFSKVVNELELTAKNTKPQIKSNLFYSVYRVK